MDGDVLALRTVSYGTENKGTPEMSPLSHVGNLAVRPSRSILFLETDY